MATNSDSNKLLSQSIIRFALVGIANTLIDIGIYTVLRSLHFNIFSANLCSTTTALLFSFIMNRRYTFQAHGNALHRQVIRFVPVTLVGLWILQPAIIYLLNPYTSHFHGLGGGAFSKHVAIVLPKLGATVISLVWNFFWYKNYVFVNPPSEE